MIGNTLRANSFAGIAPPTGAPSGYRENVFDNNAANTGAGHVNLGANLCDGALDP